jgi:hypothetical protein
MRWFRVIGRVVGVVVSVLSLLSKCSDGWEFPPDAPHERPVIIWAVYE